MHSCSLHTHVRTGCNWVTSGPASPDFLILLQSLDGLGGASHSCRVCLRDPPQGEHTPGSLEGMLVEEGGGRRGRGRRGRGEEREGGGEGGGRRGRGWSFWSATLH